MSACISIFFIVKVMLNSALASRRIWRSSVFEKIIKNYKSPFFNASTYPARSWKDGLLSSVERKNLERTVIYRGETTEWEQDLMKELQIVNPRPVEKVQILDDGQSLKTEYVYTNDDTGNIRSILQYRYNNSKKALRSITIRYLHETSPTYRKANRFNLPVSVMVEDESGNGSEKKASRTEYAS